MKPLDGIRVLDLTRLLPGAVCTQMLADFGADVIKIEEPGMGDHARLARPRIKGESAIYLYTNRNKRSLAVNLKHGAGRELFLTLAAQADVVVESFRPGTMTRLGLGYELLREQNEGLVYCAISGYGQTGPYRERAGHDLNYIGTAGLLSLLSVERDEGSAAVPCVQLADLAGGSLQAVIGILLALMARNQTGRGQLVDISMMDGSLALMAVPLAEYFATGIAPTPGETTLSGRYACYRTYRTRDDRRLAVAALEPKFWATLCRQLGREDFIRRQFDEGDSQREIISWMSHQLSEKTAAEWIAEFAPLDACVSVVNTLEEMIYDPQVRARELITSVAHPVEGAVPQTGVLPRLSETPGAIDTPAPRLGEHSRIILAEAGLTEDQIHELDSMGTIQIAD